VNRLHVFNLGQRAGSKNPWQVRWRINGKDASRQFRTKAAARDFHAKLILADGEAFDPATKLPQSWSKTATETTATTCYALVVAYLAHKWPGWAATTRKSEHETLTLVAQTVLRDGAAPGKPDAEHLRRWLAEAALIDPPEFFNDLTSRCRDDRDAAAHRWLTKHSMPITELDTEIAERFLEVLAQRRDGNGPVSAVVINRRRTQFGAFLKYCVRRGHLPSDPLATSDWKAPLVDREVARDLLLSQTDVERLLEVMRDCGKVGPRLVAFFATLFYAGLRPSEALALTADDLTLSSSGWGEIVVRNAVTSPGRRFTNDGSPRDRRHLKWRSQTSTRHVPIPPILVTYLRRHVHSYPTATDLPLFTNRVGNPLDHGRYCKVFSAAKKAAFDASSPLQRSTPYDLRHANATLLLNAGGSVADTARRLGHSPDVLLRVYAGVMTTDQVTNNTRIDAILASAPRHQSKIPTTEGNNNENHTHKVRTPRA
jgi:integrase